MPHYTSHNSIFHISSKTSAIKTRICLEGVEKSIFKLSAVVTWNEIALNKYAMKVRLQCLWGQEKAKYLSYLNMTLMTSLWLTCILVVDGWVSKVEGLAAPHHIRCHIGGLVPLHWLSKGCHHGLHKPAGAPFVWDLLYKYWGVIEKQTTHSNSWFTLNMSHKNNQRMTCLCTLFSAIKDWYIWQNISRCIYSNTFGHLHLQLWLIPYVSNKLSTLGIHHIGKTFGHFLSEKKVWITWCKLQYISFWVQLGTIVWNVGVLGAGFVPVAITTWPSKT